MSKSELQTNTRLGSRKASVKRAGSRQSLFKESIFQEQQYFQNNRRTKHLTKIKCGTEKQPTNIWATPHAANISSLFSTVSENAAAKVVSTLFSEKQKYVPRYQRTFCKLYISKDFLMSVFPVFEKFLICGFFVGCASMEEHNKSGKQYSI